MAEYLLTMQFSEEEKPFLLDITSLLYDLELAHDFGVLATEPEYRGYKFNRFFWYRHGRRIRSMHRVRAARIIKQSPLLLEIVIPSLGALWVLLQIIEKVSNWKLSREKLEFEVERLRWEQDERREKVRQRYADQLIQLAQDREANVIEQSLTKRLSEGSIRLVQFEVQEVNVGKDHNFKSDETR
jgi:hypothetical protein